MDVSHVLLYYTIKRTFLFLDEWLFYVALYKLFGARYYKIWVIVLLYGAGCIYTSYTNISKIERLIFNEEQQFYVFGFDSLSRLTNATKTIFGL